MHLSLLPVLASLATSHGASLPTQVHTNQFSSFFIENRGQWSSKAKFGLRYREGSVWLTRNSMVYDVPDGLNRRRAVSLTFGNRPVPSLEGRGKAEASFNYIGSAGSHSSPAFREVWFKGIAPGVETRVYTDGGDPRYDFVVAPGADPSNAFVRVDGAKIRAQAGNRVAIETGKSLVLQRDVYAYQMSGHDRVTVACKSYVNGNTIRFRLGSYDHRKALTIDPLLWCTYFGDSSSSFPYLSTGDTSILGEIFVGGGASTGDLVTTSGSYQPVNAGGSDGVIAKFTSDGSTLLFVTFIGGLKDDGVGSLKVASDGTVYASGVTQSTDFPTTTGAYSKSASGTLNGFVLHMNSAGSALLSSTYIPYGQSGLMDLDSSGQPVIAGSCATGFQTTPGAYSPAGTANQFVAKLNASLSTLLYATELPGTGPIFDLKLDSQGQPVVCGNQASGLPTTPGAFITSQPTSGARNCYIEKLTSDGSGLIFSTYFNGARSALSELLYSFVFDSQDRIYLTGDMDSRDVPATPGAYQAVGLGAFVAKLSADGSTLLANTYFGQTAAADGRCILLEPDGTVVLAASVGSFPTTPDALQTTGNPSGEGIAIGQLSADFSTLLYGTYLEGSGGLDRPYALWAGPDGKPALVGITDSHDFPVTAGANKTSFAGHGSGFVAKFNFSTVVQSFTASPTTVGGGNSVAATVTLKQPAPVGGETFTVTSNSAAATPPATVTVPALGTTASFSVPTQAVTSDTNVSLALSSPDGGAQTGFTVFAYRATLNPSVNSVVGGNPVQITITLNSAAPTGGKQVDLDDSGSAEGSVPAFATVPAGSLTKTFALTTFGTPSQGVVKVNATVDGAKSTTVVTLRPAANQSVVLQRSSVTAGDATTGYVLLDGMTKGARTATLSSDNPNVSVPASIGIPTDANRSFYFPVSTSLIGATQTAHITATLGGVAKSATLTVTFASFNVAVTSPVVSGHNITGTVTLPAPAGVSGFKVNLVASGASVDVPASVTVPNGATSATFPVTVYGVNETGQQSIVASAGALRRTVYVVITPPPLSSVSLTAGTISAGGSTTGRALLDGMNGSVAQAVTLSSDNVNVTVPASVTIPPNGRLSFAFSVSASAGAAGQTAHIFATLNGLTKQATLTVN